MGRCVLEQFVAKKIARKYSVQDVADSEYIISKTMNINDIADKDLSPIERIMKKYDENGDGVFDLHEVRNIVKDVQAAKQETKKTKQMMAGVLAVAMLLCGALLGLMFAANGTTIIVHTLGHSGLTDCI